MLWKIIRFQLSLGHTSKFDKAQTFDSPRQNSFGVVTFYVCFDTLGKWVKNQKIKNLKLHYDVGFTQILFSQFLDFSSFEMDFWYVNSEFYHSDMFWGWNRRRVGEEIEPIKSPLLDKALCKVLWKLGL